MLYEVITNSERLTMDLLDGKMPFFKLEKRYIHKSGRVFWINMTLTVIRITSYNVCYTKLLRGPRVVELRVVSEQRQKGDIAAGLEIVGNGRERPGPAFLQAAVQGRRIRKLQGGSIVPFRARPVGQAACDDHQMFHVSGVQA